MSKESIRAARKAVDVAMSKAMKEYQNEFNALEAEIKRLKAEYYRGPKEASHERE